MLMPTVRWSMMVLAVLAVTADNAWAMGEILGQSKEELKLEYDVSVQDHGTGRITVVLTIAEEGRLKPLQAVNLMIPMEKGQGSVDLMVSLDARVVDGKRVARVHLKKEWAERAQIWLTTYSFDGKPLVLTHYIHPISVAQYLKGAPAPAATPAAPSEKPDAAATPATERRKE